VHEFGKFAINSVYYSLREDDGGNTVISSWRFMGLIKGPTSSKSCDVPYHFYTFVLMDTDTDTSTLRRIPSLEHASVAFFTWQELLREVC
jgi:hypothetical protein